ncbi:unnamed protein product [Diabrotica balteata]|uniref:Protein kinase domain-containing protein n=1 Tax=Diabrotica balteata TaxID=107213 RepID=A0A9N9SS28_DIABA|nr:unnamed protein product [Diabrotica balteata]
MAPGLVLRESEELTLSTRGYRLLQKLGEGSYAQVFLAEFITTSTKSNDNSPEKPSRVLACKIVDVSKAPPDFVKKFLPRELDILVRISHPHIIHIHSIFQRKTKYFIFMRHAENGDLLEYVLKKGPIPEVQSRVWFRQLTLAVQYLHDMDIAHRDLKCENCLITNNYNLKLADFGFARFVTDAHGRRLTSTTYCGSLSYAAPEVLRGMPYYPKNADVWSMGIILYIMINKAMPFDDANVKRLNEQQLNRRWKFRQKVVEQLSEQVKSLVVNLLEPDITKRLRLIDILGSDWLGMDPRLKVLTQLEEAALAQAQIDRKKYIDQLNKKAGRDKKSSQAEEMKILKSTDGEEFTKQDDPSSVALPSA